jgi:hypothetical protein
LVLVKLDGAEVVNTGPITVTAGPAPGRVMAGTPSDPAATMAAGATAGAAVAAPAVDTGAAMAIVLRAVAIPIRCVRFGFMSNLPFN